jgi:hypothetical protein
VGSGIDRTPTTSPARMESILKTCILQPARPLPGRAKKKGQPRVAAGPENYLVSGSA